MCSCSLIQDMCHTFQILHEYLSIFYLYLNKKKYLVCPNVFPLLTSSSNFDQYFSGQAKNLPENCQHFAERYGSYMKVFFHQSSNGAAETDIIVDCQKLTIREELAQTKYALEIAYSNFDNVT